MSIRQFAYVLLFFFPLGAFSQNGTETFPRGARSMGMGNTHVTLFDAWSIFNNIGGLSRLTESQVFVGYDHLLNLNELTTLSAGAAFKNDLGAWGLGISSFGGAQFNQQNIGLGFSNQMGITSIGIKINYFQTNIEGFGRGAAPVIELGGVAELGPQLFFGAHIYNPTRSKLGKNAPDRLPTVVKAGFSYRPSAKIMVNMEAEKEILLDPMLKVGLEYNLMDRFWARAGVNSNPHNLFFGIGFKPKKFHLDYAMTQNNALGNTHHFSFTYAFTKQ
ncbi:hypothetical protein P872_01150 [Rhodonellum psychrophilum GCM71 = DSM 17998]|uniref:DUF5723 domain-containing protein n=3 Tax=Cytophagaceae TaxID=89373 RepID=U5BTH0_9BACT|nr:hypothetical protein P872_01150 [Rhodonellum psychrophilum GCM71 = DSM 17998]SDZ04528.1 hypothetical protein SAMN05444412_10515 [Rhodonellum ikkaensis]